MFKNKKKRIQHIIFNCHYQIKGVLKRNLFIFSKLGLKICNQVSLKKLYSLQEVFYFFSFGQWLDFAGSDIQEVGDHRPIVFIFDGDGNKQR